MGMAPSTSLALTVCQALLGNLRQRLFTMFSKGRSANQRWSGDLISSNLLSERHH